VNRHNNKTRVELEIITEVDLSEHELDKLICVATALSGVRMDLPLQEILDITVEMYNTGHPFDSVGLAILGAVRGPGEEDVH
jgi:hypothetical protein